MKRIRCTKCNRPRWTRPAASQGKEPKGELIRASRKDGREILVSGQLSRSETCLKCRPKQKTLRPIKTKAFGG